MKIIEQALQEGRTALSEFESKLVLRQYGISTTKEVLIQRLQDLKGAVEGIGFPLVVKACSSEITHKTEKALIRLDLRTLQEAEAAFQEISASMQAHDGGILVQEMIKGSRELMVGLTRDPQFGPCVMFGLGGIFTEILKDVSFRLAPLETRDAMEMMLDIKGHKILEGIRGMEPVDLDDLARILIAVGRIGLDNPAIKEVDINPLIVRGKAPVAVDALIILDGEPKKSK